MIPPLPTSQLVERIRRAAHEATATGRRATAAGIARGELPPVPEAVAPPLLAAGVDADVPFPADAELDDAANLLPRARGKITVGEGTPGWLRPLRRNQGGFNFVLLEALERLIDANRQLQRQNQALRAQVAGLGGWMNTVAQTSRLDREWMEAVENRLRGVEAERLAELEARLAALDGNQPPCASQPGPVQFST